MREKKGKYSKELRDKAKSMYNQGYSIKSIQRLLGFETYWAVLYHVSPTRKFTVERSSMKYYNKHK